MATGGIVRSMVDRDRANRNRSRDEISRMSASSSSSDFLGHALTPGPRPAHRLRGGVGLVVPVVLGGAFAVVALAGRSRLGSWLRGFLSAGDGITRDELRCRLRDDRRPLSELRAMLLGRTKAQVAARFGPPRTAVMRQPAAVAAGESIG